MPKAATAELELLQEGELLDGKYRIVRRIGRGGMAAIYLAHHELLGRPVALKVLLPEIAESPEAVQRFLHEGRAAAQLRNEHVAAVLDVGSLADGGAYIVLEFLDGCDLSALLKDRGPLPVEEVVDYALQALAAIAEAHARGIIHRDLKPANLFLTTGADGMPMVKVLDFGISKALGPVSPSDSNLTQTKTLLGSPNFMSPEQVRTPKAVDARSDVWSLGVILYQLLSGELPFGGSSFGEVLGAVLEASPTPLCELRPELPDDLGDVVARCLKRSKEERWADVAELALALKPFAPPEKRAQADTVARILSASAPMDPALAPRRPSAPGGATPFPGRAGALGPPTPRPKTPSPRALSQDKLGELPTYTPPPGSADLLPEPVAPKASRPPSQNRRLSSPPQKAETPPETPPPPPPPEPPEPPPPSPAPETDESDVRANERKTDLAMSVLSEADLAEQGPPPRRSPATLAGAGLGAVAALGLAVFAARSFFVPPPASPGVERPEPAKAGPEPTPPPAGEEPKPEQPAPDSVAKPDPSAPPVGADPAPAPATPAPQAVAKPGPPAPPVGPEPKPATPAPLAQPASTQKPATPDPAAQPAKPPPAPKPATASGTLKVMTRLDGKAFWANVSVDGKSVPTPTPITVPLAAGKHRVKIEREGFKSIEREVTIAPGATEVLKLELAP